MFSGYTCEDLVVIGEQVHLREKKAFTPMKSENHSNLKKMMTQFFEQDVQGFEQGLQELRPHLDLNGTFRAWRRGSPEATKSLEEVGLLNSNPKIDYFELSRESITDNDYKSFVATGTR